MNMAQRVRFSIAQPVTTIGWYLSSLALIGLTACDAGSLRKAKTSKIPST
jgi:potassium channel subfamily K, other eukaryote